MSFSKTTTLISLLAIGAALTFGCTDEPVPLDEAQTTIDLEMANDRDSSNTVDEIVDDINDADSRIDAALSHLQNDDITNALIDAENRGVDVRIVSDTDHRDESGFQALEDAGIMPVYGDGELSYLPDPNLTTVLGRCQTNTQLDIKQCTESQSGQGTMVRPGEYNLMSHNFVLIDKQIVWNLAEPFDGTSGPQIGWKAKSEKFRHVMRREFQQLHGGVFSIDLDVYNGENKAKTSLNAAHHTNIGQMILRQNPQERLIKTVIDRVYQAKSSIFIATDSLTNTSLLNALEYKASSGFEVRIIVNDAKQPPTLPQNCNVCPTTDARSRLQDLGARFLTGVDSIPTVVLTNATSKPNGEALYPRNVQVLSHPLWRARPYSVEFGTPADSVLIFPSDQFVDGNLWEIGEKLGNRHQDDEIDRIEDFWNNLWEEANSQ